MTKPKCRADAGEAGGVQCWSVHGADAVLDNDHSIVAHVCGSGCRKHAGVGVYPRDQESVDAASAQQKVKIGADEAVVAVLGIDHAIARLDQLRHHLTARTADEVVAQDILAGRLGVLGSRAPERIGRDLTGIAIAGKEMNDGDLPAGSRSGTRSLSVADELREAILGGTYRSGERLNEVRISQTLAVSRTPVRAALQALAGEGLLDYAPNRGFTMREFPVSEVIDAYEIRGSLEGVAARFAAERGLTDADRAVIEKSLTDGDTLLQRGSFEPGDLSTYRIINGSFTTPFWLPRAIACSPR